MKIVPLFAFMSGKFLKRKSFMHSKKELPFMNDHCMAVFTGQTAKIYQSVTGDWHLIPHPGFKPAN